jgi:hypothetical protein
MTKTDTLQLAIGAKVYCTVTACRGWYTVTAVRPRDGYIKITGCNSWCPPHNFRLTEDR